MPPPNVDFNTLCDYSGKISCYCGPCKPAYYNGIIVAMPEEKWKTLIPFLEQISTQYCVQIFIWNIDIRRFIYEVDKRGVAGYDASLYLTDDSLAFTRSNLDPQLLRAELFLNDKAVEELKSGKDYINNTVFFIDGMCKKSNGEYMHYLQQGICIEVDDRDNPLLILSYVHDFTYIKKQKTANLIITSPNGIKWWNYNFNTSTIERVSPLSKQEKIILSYLAKGKSSKHIASELFISPLTIDTHRRNLLRKTNCIDTTGMVCYARLVGLL
jgi:DNA-binding CsgD family transcriptional regulator/thiol-disulfide isomerase/thioredoxin